MNEHTPGPWRVLTWPHVGPLGAAITDSSDERRFVARVVLNDNYGANAKLIAAAPELFDALKDLVQATPTPLHNEQQIVAFDAAVRLLGRLS